MSNSSFNIVQLALVAVLAVVASGLIVACGDISAARETARRMQNNTQLRGIHQGLVTYSTSNSNRYPGINLDGDNDGIEIEARFQSLLEGDYFTPEYAISPSEIDPAIVEWDGTSPLTNLNYSFAMLQVSDANPDKEDHEQGRRTEWGQTLNSQAVVMSDRNTGISGSPTSVHTTSSQSAWSGGVLWNDNHVMFETVDTFLTKYGGGAENPSDKLFEAAGDYDAQLIHAGN